MWLGLQMEAEAPRQPDVAQLRHKVGRDFERVFELAAGVRPQTDPGEWSRDPLVVLLLVVAYGQSRAAVRHGIDVLPASRRALGALLEGSQTG
jgi:hypothetical protein